MANNRFFNLRTIQFQSILDSIERFLSNIIGGSTDISTSSVIGQLYTVISNICNNIFIYIEDAMTEQCKYSCSRKKSIFGLASLSGYQPSLGRAAGAWVRISPKPSNGLENNIIITNKTKLTCTQNGLTYSLILDASSITLSAATSSNKYFYLKQGSFESQRWVSIGGKLQVINLQYSGFIDTDTIEVKVNGELWENQASLYDMSCNSKSYYTSYNPTGGLDVCFGNGRYGREITDEDVIDVSYLTHDGVAGNIDVDENTYFVFSDKLKDICGNELDGNSMFDVRMFTEDAVASGSDAEEAATVSRMIGYNSRSLVLADANAYKSELNKYSFVGFNKTYSEPGNLVVKSVVMRNYKVLVGEGNDYFNLTDNDFILSDIQKTSIINAMEKSGAMLAGSTYIINDMELKKYALYVYIKLKSQDSDHQVVELKIRNAIGSFFADIVSDDYIPMSDLCRTIQDACEEVDGVNCYVLSKDNEEAKEQGYYYNKTYIYDPSTGTFRTEIYKTPVFEGEDPGLGMDAHGDIVLKNDDEYPVLMGGWTWRNDQCADVVAQPITVVFE